jgi:hypothetical protein
VTDSVLTRPDHALTNLDPRAATPADPRAPAHPEPLRRLGPRVGPAGRLPGPRRRGVVGVDHVADDHRGDDDHRSGRSSGRAGGRAPGSRLGGDARGQVPGDDGTAGIGRATDLHVAGDRAGRAGVERDHDGASPGLALVAGHDRPAERAGHDRAAHDDPRGAPDDPARRAAHHGAGDDADRLLHDPLGQDHLPLAS